MRIIFFAVPKVREAQATHTADDDTYLARNLQFSQNDSQ
jgi:hypothetical protein